MFANPRMNVLFDTRDKDSAVSAMDHGRRVAATILDGTHGTTFFRPLGRGWSGAFAVMGTHTKAKKCPMRPRAHQVNRPEHSHRGNRRFTTKQRVGYEPSQARAQPQSQEQLRDSQRPRSTLRAPLQDSWVSVTFPCSFPVVSVFPLKLTQPSPYRSIHLLIYPSTHLSIYLSIHLSVSPEATSCAVPRT